jgi:hypothetical protein
MNRYKGQRPEQRAFVIICVFNGAEGKTDEDRALDSMSELAQQSSNAIVRLKIR